MRGILQKLLKYWSDSVKLIEILVYLQNFCLEWYVVENIPLRSDLKCVFLGCDLATDKETDESWDIFTIIEKQFWAGLGNRAVL